MVHTGWFVRALLEPFLSGKAQQRAHLQSPGSAHKSQLWLQEFCMNTEEQSLINPNNVIMISLLYSKSLYINTAVCDHNHL